MMMSKFRKQLLIGLTSAGLVLGSLGAIANQPGGKQEPAQTTQGQHGKHDGRMAEHMAKRHAELKEKLKLNASQTQAWDRYVANMKPSMHQKRGGRAEMEKLSAPERMEKMISMSKEREARMVQRLASLKEFYAVLTPQQKKTFDAETLRGGRHHKRHHRG
jgi:protein CpxP